jgi:hypothetical protein
VIRQWPFVKTAKLYSLRNLDILGVNDNSPTAMI